VVKRGDKLPTRWGRPPHTKAKHDILVAYLHAWFAIFGQSQRHSRVVVFDGFAGPGRYSEEESGSPVLSLEALLDHNAFPRFSGTEFVFLFNEFDKARSDSLELVLEEFSEGRGGLPDNVKVHTESQNFSKLAEQI